MPGLIPEATGQAGGMIDPFGAANQLMEFQLRMNQNKQFQTQFMANQALGEMVAHAPSLKEGLDQASQNPLIAGFSSQLSNLKAIQQMDMSTADIQQRLGQSGFEAAMRASAQSIQDPLHYNDYFTNGMKFVDPSVQDRVRPMVDQVRSMIGDRIKGLNLADPAQLQQAKDLIKTSMAGAFTLAGGDRSHLEDIFGKVELTPEGVPVQMPGVVGVSAGQGPALRQQGGPVPAGVGPAGTPTGPAPVPVINSTDTSLPPMNAAADVSHMIATDPASGRPIMSVTTGTPKLKPGFQRLDDDLKREFADEGKQYNAATNMISGLDQMNNSVDALAKGGGFVVPGFMGGSRKELATAIKTFQDITGNKFDFMGLTPGELDQDIMNATTLDKWHNVITFNMKNMLESTGARGLGVLMEAEGAVPGMENTPLSIKVLTAELKAVAVWQAGKYEFKNHYMQNNPANTLVGADEAYNRQSSPADIAKRELAKFNMKLTDAGELVFNDKTALDKAADDGLLGDGDALKETYKHFYSKIYPSK